MKRRIVAVLMMTVLVVGILSAPVSAAGKNGLQDQKVKGQWVYMKDGKIDTSYTGLAKNKNGWFYVKKGVVDFTYSGLVKNQYGWWKVTNGKVDFNFSGLAKNSKGWWKVVNGKVDFSFTGFMKNSKGWWYVKNGNIDMKTTSIVKGTIDGKTGWYYVKNSKYTTEDTSREVWHGMGGNWYHPTTWVAKNSKGWWLLENGKVDFKYTGVGSNVNGYWYVKKGKVDFSANGWITKDDNYTYAKKGSVLVDMYDSWSFAASKDYTRVIIYDAVNHKFHASNCSLLKSVPAKEKKAIYVYYDKDGGFTESARYYGNYKYKDRWSYYQHEGVERWTYCKHCLSEKEDSHGVKYYTFK